MDGADEVRLLSQMDRFGNVVYHVSSSAVQESVAFTAEFTVERFATAEPLRIPADDDSVEQYLPRTALTAPDARIRDEARALAAEIRATSVAALAAEVLPRGAGQLDADGVRQWAAAQCGGLWAARAITYQFGVTGVQTPAAMALHLGRGVCQDYAHLAIACCACSASPRATSRATCWARARRTPGSRRCSRTRSAPDAAARRRVRPDPPGRPGLNYITVAVGRDFADVTPTSGTFQGATGHFTARKNAWIVELA